MAEYAVKSGGTAGTTDNGRTTGTLSGSFAARGAANYYDNILECFNATTPATNGDVIKVSHLHSHAPPVNTTYTVVVDGAPLTIVSVSDTEMSQAQAGASEVQTAINVDTTFTGHFVLHGMTIYSTDDFSLTVNSRVVVIDSDIGVGESSDNVNIISDGCSLQLINSILRLDDDGANLQIRGGSRIDMFGGSVSKTGGGQLIAASSSNGGASAFFKGVDLSELTTYVLAGTGAGTADDSIYVEVYDCELGTLTDYVEEDLLRYSQRVKVSKSSDTSANAEHQFYEKGYAGEVQDNSTIYREESGAFPSGAKVSAQVTTTADASEFTPFYFDLLKAPVDLSDTASDVITLYFASTAALTTQNFYVDVVYPDGTNNQERNYVTTRLTDILSAGTAHTDDSGASDWRNGAGALTGYNEYRLDIDTSGNPGADGVPVIRVYIGEPSIDVYVDTSIGVS